MQLLQLSPAYVFIYSIFQQTFQHIQQHKACIHDAIPPKKAIKSAQKITLTQRERNVRVYKNNAANTLFLTYLIVQNMLNNLMLSVILLCIHKYILIHEYSHPIKVSIRISSNSNANSCILCISHAAIMSC